MYINPVTLSNQSNPAPGLLPLTAEQEAMYIQYNGFVKLTIEDVAVQDSGNGYTVQKRITKLEPDTESWEAWKAAEAEKPPVVAKPTLEERTTALEAAMLSMMGVNLNV